MKLDARIINKKSMKMKKNRELRARVCLYAALDGQIDCQLSEMPEKIDKFLVSASIKAMLDDI